MQLVKKWENLNSKQRNLIGYFLKLVLIWLSWKFIISILGEQKVPINERIFPAVSDILENFNNMLAGWLMDASQFLLIKQGYYPLINGRTIWLHPLPGVTIGNYCLGLQLMYYFILVVAITPMSWGRKLLGIFGGIGLVWLLNIARINGLVLLSYHAPQHLYIAHDHVFNIAVFAVLLPILYL
jgi:exosortase/archaeosortase family protein